MKQIASLLILLLAGQTEAVKLTGAGSVSCEELGTCAPSAAKNVNGFVAKYDANSLYSFTEQDNIQKEIEQAQKYMDAKRQ